MPNRPELKFPKNFLWGVSTSAHQVEGGLHNQWTVWELENAKSLATQAPYQYDDLDNWNDIKRLATTPANYVSRKATNHYDLFEQDIELIAKMNMNAFRFSIEWSSIQPEKEAWNAEEVDHYKAVLAACKKRGIEPVVTLFHFTLPTWFADIGGFEKTANIKYFVSFADRILSELGSGIKYVLTMNEPEVYVDQGYLEGRWPPQQANKRLAQTVKRNLVKAHNQTAEMIHAKNRRYKVSIAKNYSYIYPGDDAWLSVRSVQFKQRRENDWFLKRIIKHCDFIGVNYYFSDRIYGYRIHNPDEKLSDMGWDMQPYYLVRALEQLHEMYDKPILITENGLADANDEYRQWWLTQTILAMQQAIGKGVDLIGYLHWSLLDNFEWDKGYWPRFGLFAVDYRTYKRTPRPSALWFAKLLKKLRTS